MCGIAGIAGHRRIDVDHRIALGAMLDRLTHRGPDDTGDYLTEHVALGHRRLSIIDLETGRQPLSNEDGSVWLVANGEIYNFLDLRDDLLARGHRFRTTSDSECIVHLYEEYGVACVERLSGMFALAIWDEPHRRLLLARDRLGVKPLYYQVDDDRLIFASERKAIAAAPDVSRELDPTALLDYLTFGYIPSPGTIDKHCRKLPPAHRLVFEEGHVRIQRYWDLHHRGRDEQTLEESAAGLWHALKQATRPRLLADVSIGAFLSGGLDSAAVTAAMTQLARDEILTLSCGFDEQGFDERQPAADTAAKLHTHHLETCVKPDAACILDTLAWHFDEPFADASAIPTYYLSQQARRFVTVALSGDGGDEILAGYRRYRFDQYEQWFRRWVPGRAGRGMLARIASIYPERAWIPQSLRAAATLRNLSVDAPTAHGLSIATMNPWEARALLAPSLRDHLRDYDPLDHVRRHYARCDAPDHLSRCQYTDICLGLGDGILTKVDRASMAHGLEVRSPMLDHCFVESAWRIPPEYRIQRQRGKAVLRHAVARVIDPIAADRVKRGFEVPLDDWFKGPLRGPFQDRVLPTGSSLHAWFSPGAIRDTWDRHISGRARCGATLWKLIMLDAWLARESEDWRREPGRVPPGHLMEKDRPRAALRGDKPFRSAVG